MTTTVPPTLPTPPAAPRWRVGVDGGGSGTRLRLLDVQGRVLGVGEAGPSGLSQGVAQAWRHVQQALDAAWVAAGLLPADWRQAAPQLALGLGLAGAEVRPQHTAFCAAVRASVPALGALVLGHDGTTQLLGAHAGRAGVVVAAGTGSVATARAADGTVHTAGAWGFPAGDEGGGAWLGRHAVQVLQRALDGRDRQGALTTALTAHLNATPDTAAAALLDWCATAGQQAYATLAPLVFDAAEAADPVAGALLQRAADELAALVHALDARVAAQGRADRQPAGLPVVLTGSIGRRLLARWAPALRARVVEPAGDAIDGALRLLEQG